MSGLRLVPRALRFAHANVVQERLFLTEQPAAHSFGSCSRSSQVRYQHGYAQDVYIQQQQPASRFGRASRFVFKFGVYSLGAVSCILGGAVLAVYTEPDSMKWKDILSRTAPSAEETLQLYKPPDSESAQINDAIVSHPIAKELRSNPNFKESRPHLGMPEGMRPSSLTGGTLSGPGRITVPPLFFHEEGGKSVVSIFYLGEQLCGHPGIVHGGLLATLLDEGLARCCFPALPNKVGVTAYLKINYLKPAKANNIFVLRAETVELKGRKATVNGYIEQLPADGEEGEAVKCVEAQALYIEPKNAQYLRYMRNRVETT